MFVLNRLGGIGGTFGHVERKSVGWLQLYYRYVLFARPLILK